MRNKQHQCDNHPVFIDWEHTNSAGLPAIKCEQCVIKNGARRGQPRWVTWLSQKDLFKMRYPETWETHYANWKYYRDIPKEPDSPDTNPTYHNYNCYDG